MQPGQRSESKPVEMSMNTSQENDLILKNRSQQSKHQEFGSLTISLTIMWTFGVYSITHRG